MILDMGNYIYFGYSNKITKMGGVKWSCNTLKFRCMFLEQTSLCDNSF